MADLRTINNLEASLSPNHVTSIRIRVIEAEGSLQDYQDTLEHELKLSNEAIANLKAQRQEKKSPSLFGIEMPALFEVSVGDID